MKTHSIGVFSSGKKKKHWNAIKSEGATRHREAPASHLATVFHKIHLSFYFL